MRKKKNTDSETWIQVLLGVLAILTIKSLFEHDNSKIISKKGSKVLSDDKKMHEIERKIKAMDKQKESNQNEIII